MNKLLAFFISFNVMFAQQIKTPIEQSNYSKYTSYSEIINFVNQIDSASGLINCKLIGKSVEGRELVSLFFSNNEFGEDSSKMKVLIFAQQHGNEQSGKEGALLLVNELLKPENEYLFDRIDFALIPQMNPDGSEQKKRRNGNNADLNRNHLILTEPETIALHELFNEYLFEANMDVHEYYPFGEDWVKYGYRRNFDEQIGGTTNINVSEKIREKSSNEYLPFIKNYLNENGFSYGPYIPGGIPGEDFLRYSTFDINDGRQSFGILNSFSFIQEGINGIDYTADNIKHRAEGQMTGMLGFLTYIYENAADIKTLVHSERKKLINPEKDEKIAIQLDHVSDGTKLEYNLLSYKTNSDTTFIVNDFRPKVISLYDVTKPKGYLIHKDSLDLINWANKHNLKYFQFVKSTEDKVIEYFVNGIDSIDFEGDIIVNPTLISRTSEIIADENYLIIPTNQLYGNMIVNALEPKAMLGLVTYDKYKYLLKNYSVFPIYRLE